MVGSVPHLPFLATPAPLDVFVSLSRPTPEGNVLSILRYICVCFVHERSAHSWPKHHNMDSYTLSNDDITTTSSFC